MTDKMTDIEGDAIELLLSQFQEKEKVEGLLQAVVSPLQGVEDDIFEIRNLRDIEIATGATIDQIGEIVGISRGGRDDDEYRTWIKAQIGVNTSRGSIEEVANIFNLLTGATLTHVYEIYPCTVRLICNVSLAFDLSAATIPFGFFGAVGAGGFGVGAFAGLIDGASVSALILFIDKVLAGGVRVDSIGYYESETPFSFSGFSSGGGFGVGEFATLAS